LGQNKIQHNLTQYHANVTDVKFKKVVEIDFAWFLHHVVADVVSENGEKYWSDIVEALNVSKFWMVAEKIVKDHEYVILAFFSE
jgi:hypothetical protein